MADLYVYYKVRGADAPALAPRVRALQAALARRTGVTGGLKRRPGMRDGLQTWMEVYAGVDDAFPDALAAALAEAAIEILLAGPRHAEVFEDMPVGDLTVEDVSCA